MSHRDIVQIIFVTLLWSLCFPLIGIAVADAPPLLIGALRAIIAGLVLLVLAKAQNRTWPPRKTLIGIAFAGLGLTGMGFAGMFLSGGRVSPGLAGVLANIQPLLAAVLGVLFLQEKLRGRAGIALTIGFAGIVLTAYPTLIQMDGNSSAAGIGYILLGAIGVASGNVILKRVAGKVDAIVASGFSLAVGAIPLILLSLAMGDFSKVHMSVELITVIAVLSLFGTALVSVLWLDLLQRNELLQINVYTFLTPIFGLSIAAIFFYERLSPIEWTGVALIVSATVVMSTAPRHKN